MNTAHFVKIGVGIGSLIVGVTSLYGKERVEAAQEGLGARSEGDWVSLFDGDSTKGWTPRGEVESFRAVGDELQIVSQKNVWIVSDVVLTDFEVEAEVKLPDDAIGFNSGLGFRLVGSKGKPKGYQCEIDLGLTGGIYGIGMGGWLYPKSAEDKASYKTATAGLFKPKEWNVVKVRCVGSRMQTWVNGKPVADITGAKKQAGRFGIQHHGKGRLVKFRNLRAKNLGSP